MRGCDRGWGGSLMRADIPGRILYHVLMSDTMVRINLNVPPDVKSQLREEARRAGRTEAEVTRALLVDGLDRARREAFFRGVADGYSEDVRARDLEILRRLEALGG